MTWILSSLMLAVITVAPMPATAATTANVTVVDFAFQPLAVTIDSGAGNAIVFAYPTGFSVHRPHSNPGNPHGTVFDGACLNMPVNITPGNTISVPVTLTPECLVTAAAFGKLTPDLVQFPYHCHIHPGMVGTVTVNL